MINNDGVAVKTHNDGVAVNCRFNEPKLEMRFRRARIALHRYMSNRIYMQYAFFH